MLELDPDTHCRSHRPKIQGQEGDAHCEAALIGHRQPQSQEHHLHDVVEHRHEVQRKGGASPTLRVENVTAELSEVMGKALAAGGIALGLLALIWQLFSEFPHLFNIFE